MPTKLKYEDVKKIIEVDNYKLLSTEYHNSKDFLSIKCGICDVVYQQSFTNFRLGYRHQYCKGKTPMVTWVYKNCSSCGKEMHVTKSHQRKTCSLECVQKKRSEAGKKGASIVVNRSKNEILFAELCAKHFEILTNIPIFDGWDADVIIPQLKLVVFWNGIWHYKQVRGNHNLSQSQARDKVKTSVITKKFGYNIYVIKDMGHYNPSFVKEQFDRFLQYVYFI